MDYSTQTSNFLMFAYLCFALGFKNTVDFIRNLDYQGFAINALTLYSESVEQCKIGIQYAYDIPYVKESVTNATYYLTSLKCALIGQRIEPLSSDWISCSVLNESIMSTRNIIETYDYLVDTNRSASDEFYYTCSSLKSVIISDSKMKQGLVTMKLGWRYFTRFYNSISEYPNASTVEDSKPFTNKFLSIEYTHPEMSQGIVMNLERGYWLVENHILSNVFIKRWLEYQAISHIFDNRYTIKILDGDVSVIELRWGQNIVLGEGGKYEIV
jgi:hypothetical protein